MALSESQKDTLEAITDDELIEEIEARGYVVFDEGDGATFNAAVYALQRGEYAEGMLLLERALPVLDSLLLQALSTQSAPTAAPNISGAATGVRPHAASTAPAGRETIPAVEHHDE